MIRIELISLSSGEPEVRQHPPMPTLGSSPGRGRTWAIIASLIQTAKLDEVEPFVCLFATSSSGASPATRLDEFLP
ncbi:MAG: hypothetical protein QOK29_4898 [Rhodospirillaceae bacterium]|nr:hypothetical protein [Rhodospirillaceae bacterium]